MAETAAPAPRRRSPLKLRPAPVIALAYVLGPVAGLTVFGVLMLLDFIVEPGRGAGGVKLLSFAFFYVYLVIFGGLICLAVEVVFVTPVLVAFNRYRWAWLNGWTAGLIGFGLGFAAALLVIAVSVTPQQQTDWGMTTVVNGHRTLIGWVMTLGACTVIGVVGLVAAGVFRLLAVRRDDEAEGAGT